MTTYPRVLIAIAFFSSLGFGYYHWQWCGNQQLGMIWNCYSLLWLIVSILVEGQLRRANHDQH
jgi:hypothetical protein